MSKPIPRVRSIDVVGATVLHVRFSDGTERRSTSHRCSSAGCTDRSALPALLAMILLPSISVAQDLLIRGATVHTSSPRGTMEGGDVLVRNGRIAEVGTGLAAAPGITVIDARGRPLTAGIFGGITAFGVEEISGEPSTVDNSPIVRAAGERLEPRPEFDVSVAFNPESVPISVNRAEGHTFAVVAPSAVTGGTVLAGQGAVARLDGRLEAFPATSRTLFVNLGPAATSASGMSRARSSTSP